MSRRSSGLIGVWAEAQRQQQRQQEAQRRASVQQQRQREREQRAQERDAARATREQQAAYRQSREADARLRTQELDAQVEELTGLLAAGCAAPPFSTGSLRRTQQSVEPFAPGALAQPIPMPDPARYQPQGGGWTANRRAQSQQEAQARYQRDWDAAQLAETERRRQLAEYRAQYDAWAATRQSELHGHNQGVEELVTGLRAAEPGAVVEYFSAALYAADGWPEGFPRRLSCSYDRGAKQLVLDWELPGFDVVPEAKSVRYVASSDEERESARPVTQRRALYRDTLAQSVLLVVRDLFAADEYGVLESVAFNGFVDDVDPANGRRAEIFLATVMVDRAAFQGLHLEQVSAVDCLVDALHGQLSARPDQRAGVRPVRRPGELGAGVLSHGSDEDEPDLFVMDPIEFEVLVAELFRARGMRAVTTQRSNDGGVDVEALDADPISGGRIIVQVKRYRNTVPPTAVRDLYGTVQGAGANKGVLVTTSGFGPGSYAFAQGKPLTLVSGAELVELLHECGLRGRLGERGERATPTPTLVDTPLAPPPSESSEEDFNVLGMTWAGPVALDVCVLVCAGNRVLDDDHFVFFNNREVPGGSVRMVPGAVEDRAAVRVAFDALPPRADRLVLVASVDPEVNPDADLSGFTDAGILLRDASGTELDRLPVSEGRAGETALVLGSFRRRAGDDWDFVLGGRGYVGGLEALIGDFGIEVE
ncbi:restriction endonuclease [Streptomyces sp. CBMA152]|uniref:restriction endonuclease n=1 Tax=Streptomyces sp. CBMA152 TaxID=1896312 RepID=UPI0016616005|nr:restriction endonuclease [Streptomyces sp. CBMA152]MBD0746235.1 restriction endonuclease [Streptomyces sp. CBMA152]